MHGDIAEVLFSAQDIHKRVQALGRQISNDLAGREAVVLALLKGSVLFFSDLVRSIDAPVKVDFAWASSYGSGTTSSGQIHLKVFPEGDLRGRTVVVVDDILDTGRTLDTVVRRIREEHGATDVRTCVLLDKQARRSVDIRADYTGFPVDDVFVVGYGLDYADRYRNLPYIGVLKPECYQS
ncbi:MAG: hypoxanthine phosphoribosyltransferase [Planctomycetes bacterium]|nr:hypoxanthine phosphoribosyltransferase [Planctomycetota bacterium]